MQSDELTMDRLCQLARRYAWAMQRPALELQGTVRWRTANRLVRRCSDALINAVAAKTLQSSEFWAIPANARDLYLAAKVFGYVTLGKDLANHVHFGQRLLSAALEYAENTKEQGQ